MIYLEILFFVLLFAALIYFAFFSKRVQNFANKASDRAAHLSDPTTTDAVIERLDKVDQDFAEATDAYLRRQQALKEEQEKLNKISE